MKTVDVKTNTYIECLVESNIKDLNCRLLSM